MMSPGVVMAHSYIIVYFDVYHASNLDSKYVLFSTLSLGAHLAVFYPVRLPKVAQTAVGGRRIIARAAPVRPVAENKFAIQKSRGRAER